MTGSQVGKEAPGSSATTPPMCLFLRFQRPSPPLVGRYPVQLTQQRIDLSAVRDVPLDKLMLSRSNVRHVKAAVPIEELAEGEV